jgi:hypothetical protein
LFRLRVRALALAIGRAIDLDLDLDRGLALDIKVVPRLDVGRMREISESLRQQAQCEGPCIAASRKQLLVCVLGIFIAESDEFARRRAQLDYEMCLFELVRPHLSRERLEKLAPTGLTLRLLRARMDGEVPPYEGILLVRNKIVP